MSSNTNRGNLFGGFTPEYNNKVATGYFQKTHTVDHNIWSAYGNNGKVTDTGFHTQTGQFWNTFFR